MKRLVLILLFFISSAFILSIYAQSPEGNEISLIEAKNDLWNKAFNGRDSVSLFTLYAPESAMISAGGKWVNKTEIKAIVRRLFTLRPDITWYNKAEKIEVNKQWMVAYETGTWTESWTEKDDAEKSTITGKYWIMYRKKEGQWFVHSSIYTPMTCEGSYCR